MTLRPLKENGQWGAKCRKAYDILLDYEQKIHLKNQKRIRIGLKCLIIIPLIFLAMLFWTGSSKTISKMNGLSALMKIREKNNIPIIMLSAKTEESDKVIGLSMGADDYVTKPYNTAELMARVKSQLRRYFSLGAANGTTQSQDILKNGGLLLNRNTKELLVDGAPVRLTATEYKIMELLMEHPGYVFSAEEIYSQVWQEDAYSVENTVMVHIRRIREKIEITPKNPKYLKVVWGIGYKIEKIDGN